MKKTQQEIVNRIKELSKENLLFDFRIDNLMVRLDFDHVMENFKDKFNANITRESWGEPHQTSPVDEIKDYMDFAWEKANNCRGLSAARSLQHMESWLWLDGQEEFIKEIDISNYRYYGKGKLVKICEKYGIDWKALDDGQWRNNEDGDYVTAEIAMATVC